MTEEAMDTEPVLSVAEEDTKWDIRNKVWDYLETNNLASFPRPVKNRIPNFKGAAAACEKAAELECFKEADAIKINPDKPQEQARFKALEASKTLLVPTPRLRRGLFNKIQPPDNTKGSLRFCSTSQGVRQHSTSLDLDMKVKVDLVIVGSVAISEDGLRIGKGEGFADLEYAMMAAIGSVDENTIVVSCVHDCQVMKLPEELFGPHDITVDYICTPTRVIKCSPRPKPKAIIWSLLSLDKFTRIPILKVLREQEMAAGKDVTLKDVSHEEFEEALTALIEKQEEERAERAAARQEAQGDGDLQRGGMRRNRGWRRNRKSDGRDHEGMNGIGGTEGDEHADGEDSPSGDPKRRPNDRRRRMRNRRRNRDSERLNSEGEPYSSGAQNEDSQADSAQENRDDGGRPNRRRQRPRRPRRRPQEAGSGTENGEFADGKSSPDGRYDGPRNEGSRRFRRGDGRGRFRQRRSEGDRDIEQHQDGQEQHNYRPPRRQPGRFRYRNTGRRDGRPDDRQSEDADHAYSRHERNANSPIEDRRRRDRPRRNNNLPMVYIGSLPRALRVSDFKKQVRDRDVNPLRVLWRGSNGHVFMIFQSMDETEDALKKLDHLSINEKEVKVALANRTERRRKGDDEDDERPRGPKRDDSLDRITDQVASLEVKDNTELVNV